ncbi:sulfotransferase family protein [Parasedimentitalea marina]|nr:sulfotransferase family protein [Parasedimentitalea marina]
MRTFRKKIYILQDSNSRFARFGLLVVLSAYRVLDILFLKKPHRLDRSTEIVASPDRRFVCVLVPKCGSRTILAGLQQASRMQKFGLSIKKQSVSNFKNEHEGNFQFAIVRDPWARTYSCYKQKIKDSKPISQALHLAGRKGLNPDMTFDEFVHWLCNTEGGDHLADRHWASQHLILGLDLGISYDFIGKLENMEQSLIAVADKLGIPKNSFNEHKNSTTSSKNEHLNHYTPELIDMISKRYAEDIRTFGYEQPIL